MIPHSKKSRLAARERCRSCHWYLPNLDKWTLVPGLKRRDNILELACWRCGAWNQA